MTTCLLHPATARLLWLQSRGRRRRIVRRFCQTRRLVLSGLACLLAVVWLGNAALTVWLRESAEPETLRALLSMGLVLYAGWHFAKAAFFRPENPFDWSPAERDILAAMPLRPRELVAYQLASVTVNTLIKSALFVLLLLPDLHCLPLGFAGVLLAMMALELLRMAIEIATWGMSRIAFLVYRALVVAGLVAAGSAIGIVIVRHVALGGPIHAGAIHGGKQVFQPLLDILLQLNASVVGVAARPFQPLLDLVLADRIDAHNATLAAVSLATVSAQAAGVIVVFSIMVRLVAQRQRRDYQPERDPLGLTVPSAGSDIRPAPLVSLRLPLRTIPRLGGAGALAWRQLVGARRQAGSLLTAMIAPAVLASAPSFMIADPFFAFLATTGTLAFYTFLLLPTALRFDFRRDLDRLATLKGLPVTPAAVVAGQTLAPVLIATLFQCLVLAFAAIARSVPPQLLLTAILIMAPLNVLVFGLDNLIYLLYPHRVHQEGLEIFVRTMLTFTAKGLLFTFGLVLLSVWGFAAADLALALSHWTGTAIPAAIVFTVGMIVGPSLLAGITLYGLSRTYHHLDAVEDVPQ